MLDKDFQSLDFFDKAIELNPHEYSYYFNKGLSLLWINEYEKAIEVFDTGFIIFNKDAHAFYYK